MAELSSQSAKTKRKRLHTKENVFIRVQILPPIPPDVKDGEYAAVNYAEEVKKKYVCWTFL